MTRRHTEPSPPPVPEKMTVEELKERYDWGEAFTYGPANVSRDDVVEVVASVDGENDGDPWVGVFKLKDGRYLYLSAGCDYTGWDCRAGGHGDTRPTLHAVIRELCEEDDRRRLGLILKD